MTLWELLFRWLRQHRPRRRYWMAAWPQWTKPPRFNIVQRYLMRRAALVVLGLIVFKINPFHPIPVLLSILGITLVMQEHSIHKKQEASLRHQPKRKDGW